MRRATLIASTFTALLIGAAGILLLAPVAPAQDDPQANKPGTKEHWFQYFRGDVQVGVLKVEVVRDDEAFILRDMLVVFDRDHEIQVLTEIHYRGAGRALKPKRATVSVSYGNDSWLDGSLKFGDDHILEAYRKTQDGELIERRHPWSNQLLLSFSGIPFIAPQILDEPGTIDVVFPVLPRGLKGPILQRADTIYKLTRTEGEAFEYRLRGTSTSDKRTTIAKTESGEVVELILEPQFRFVRSRRGVCLGWYMKRAKKTIEGGNNPDPPKEEAKDNAGRG